MACTTLTQNHRCMWWIGVASSDHIATLQHVPKHHLLFFGQKFQKKFQTPSPASESRFVSLGQRSKPSSPSRPRFSLAAIATVHHRHIFVTELRVIPSGGGCLDGPDAVTKDNVTPTESHSVNLSLTKSEWVVLLARSAWLSNPVKIDRRGLDTTRTSTRQQ